MKPETQAAEFGVTRVEPHQLEAVWPRVEPMLARALEKGFGEIETSQLRLLIVRGLAVLIVGMRGDEIHGAMAVEFTDYPNYRVANIIAIGGRLILGETAAWETIKSWMKNACGCRYVQGFASESIARLWRRVGFTEAYLVVRSPL